jgi:hypothetical protein
MALHNCETDTPSAMKFHQSIDLIAFFHDVQCRIPHSVPH